MSELTDFYVRLLSAWNDRDAEAWSRRRGNDRPMSLPKFVDLKGRRQLAAAMETGILPSSEETNVQASG